MFDLSSSALTLLPLPPEYLCIRVFFRTYYGLILYVLSLYCALTLIHIHVLLCQPKVIVTSCFVYKVIRDLESIDHLCINPIHWIEIIHK